LVKLLVLLSVWNGPNGLKLCPFSFFFSWLLKSKPLVGDGAEGANPLEVPKGVFVWKPQVDDGTEAGNPLEVLKGEANPLNELGVPNGVANPHPKGDCV
jgi:hypothetical protein